MPTYDDQIAAPLLAPKIMAEIPVDSASEYAQLIMNWTLDPAGFLESHEQWMPLIPRIWDGGNNPTAFANVRAIGFALMDGGSVPEIIFITKTGVFRYAPWTRAASTHGLEELLEWKFQGASSSSTSVVPQELQDYPAQIRSSGNRVYFTLGDGGCAWVWDGDRLRRFGFPGRPGAPGALGPSRSATSFSDANAGGFSLRGRIGTTDASLTRSVESVDGEAIERWAYGFAKQVGGVRDGSWSYSVVFENVDGAYSAVSGQGGSCTMRFRPADPDNGLDMSELRKRFWIQNIPIGPPGTVARILLRTPNLDFLGPGDFGDMRFLHRLPNNVSEEWIDDIPDGELGGVWTQREVTPQGFRFFEFFGGSMWMMRTDGHPSRVWWSEQGGPLGPLPESIMVGDYRDVSPNSGPITGSIVTRPAAGAGGALMLVGKSGSMDYITGQWPQWSFGTLHSWAGLAGPDLIQSCPDGSVIWYGNKTFWRFTPRNGSVVDIGIPIRKRLRRINQGTARLGRSWVDRRTNQVHFALPLDDSTANNLQFIWDFMAEGWRLADSVTVEAVLSIPNADMVLIAGSLVPGSGGLNAGGRSPTVWIHGRGHPGEVFSQRDSTYISGWVGLAGSGPNLGSQNTWMHAVLTMEERGSGEASISTYLDWNMDLPSTVETIHAAHPEQTAPDGLSFWGSRGSVSPLYSDSALWRSRRTYNELVALSEGRHSVAALHIVTTDAFAIYTGTTIGSRVAGPGAAPFR